MSYCKLTICFDDPFWIGLVETEDDDGRYSVARHVFGPEPTDPQVEEFIKENWNSLRFTPALQVEKTAGKKMNYKRMQRVIAKEVAAHARRGTKAQQALSEAREEHKIESRKASKADKAAREKERFEERKAKRKRKRKGH